jgi:hypothetical protein
MSGNLSLGGTPLGAYRQRVTKPAPLTGCGRTSDGVGPGAVGAGVIGDD